MDSSCKGKLVLEWIDGDVVCGVDCLNWMTPVNTGGTVQSSLAVWIVVIES